MIPVPFIAFACEWLDASIGMGFGTILTPVLLMLGFDAQEVVPAVLLAQLVSGLTAGLTHHKLRNMYLDFRRDPDIKKWVYLPRSNDAKVVFILSLCGLLGAAVGAFTAIQISKVALNTFIGIMVVIIGILILSRFSPPFNWKAMIGLGLVSAFNKGMSGGGYGPLVTGGQLVIGREARQTIGTTTISEPVVCAVGFLAYVIFGGTINWPLTGLAILGAVCAAPLAAHTTKHLKILKPAIGAVTVILGIVLLVKTLF